MAHSDLKNTAAHLKTEDPAPEPLSAGELLMVWRFINDFFLDHYINPTGDDEDFSMVSPETLSKS